MYVCLFMDLCKRVAVTNATQAARPDNILKAGSLGPNSCACRKPDSILYYRLQIQSKLEGDIGGAGITNG
jgi:hypothetical protein